METLFNLPELVRYQKHEKDDHCKTCINFERWQCGGSIFFYCKTRRSKYTQNGLLKIKAGDVACPLHEVAKINNNLK